MRGIILCGGSGTRLGKLTQVTNKHLLPVFEKPMCFYPIETLVRAGINEIMIVVGGQFAGNFIPLLKNGEDFGLRKLVYGYQSKTNGGIADAILVAEEFADNDNIAVILGDNCTDANIFENVEKFNGDAKNATNPLAHIFLKEVSDPHRFGVAKFDWNNNLIKILEKPTEPPTNLAVTGLYLYDRNVFNFAKSLHTSSRGEKEVSDLNNVYIQRGNLTWSMLEGYWRDAGTPETLYEANKYWAEK